MTYISDEEIAGLPEDPEEAFVVLESIVRGRYEGLFERLGNNEGPVDLQRRYMSIVLPAARHYGIKDIAHWERPANSNSWEVFDAFIAEVDYCITDLRLKNHERARLYTVKLDAAAKIKLRHLLTEIREAVAVLDISVTKKDRLYARVNALQDEVDRERTREQAFGALMIEACDDIGEAAKKLQPVVSIIGRVGQAIGIAKRAEDAQPRLPRPKEPKRIEARKPAKKNFEKDLDDEIPF